MRSYDIEYNFCPYCTKVQWPKVYFKDNNMRVKKDGIGVLLTQSRVGFLIIIIKGFSWGLF